MRIGRIVAFGSMVAMVAGLGLIAGAQEETPPPSGIFVEAPAGQAEVRLAGTTLEDLKATGLGKSMLTMGLAKPQMKASISGAKADTRVAGDVTFRFQFNQRAGSNPQDMTLADMMSVMGGLDGSIPSMVRGPQDLVLLRLAATDELREVHLGTAGGGRPKDAVDVKVEKVGPGVFRVKPKRALPPGEYAFCALSNGSPMNQAWDFGVDQK